EVVARRIPGVARARAFKGYDLQNDLTDQPGHVTVAVVDASGGAVDGPTKTAVEAELTSDNRRALNVVVHVTDPDEVSFAVDFAAIARPGFDAAAVQAAGIAALQAALHPATWGTTAADEAAWEPRDTVYINDLVGLLYDVPGI